MSERALELAIALEDELLAQCDKLETLIERPEYSDFPVNEIRQIERKHAEISGLMTQANCIKYQLSK